MSRRTTSSRGLGLRARAGLLAAASACVGLTGCLDVGEPLYPRRDTTPPSVVSTEPVSGGVIAPGDVVRITFSETMDLRSLRPGIAVFAGRDEVALTLTAPEVPELEEDVERGDIPYTVEARATAGTLLPGTAYTLVLRDLLTDYEGNPLPSEVRVAFRTGTSP